MKPDNISVPDDWLSFKEKIQYKTEVRYDEIEKIELIKSAKNSINKNIKIRSGMAPTYIQFTCKNEVIKRIFIFHHTIGQRIKIINEIKARMKHVGNTAEIPDSKELVMELYKPKNKQAK